MTLTKSFPGTDQNLIFGARGPGRRVSQLRPIDGVYIEVEVELTLRSAPLGGAPGSGRDAELAPEHAHEVRHVCITDALRDVLDALV